MHENQQKQQFLIDMVRRYTALALVSDSMITNEPADHAYNTSSAVYTTFAKLEIVEIRLT